MRKMKSETTKQLEKLNITPRIIKNKHGFSTNFDTIEIGFIRFHKTEYDLHSKRIKNIDELINSMNRRIIDGILNFDFKGNEHKWYNTRENVHFKVRNVVHLLMTSPIFDKKNNLKLLLDYLYSFNHLSDKMEEFALRINPKIFNGDKY